MWTLHFWIYLDKKTFMLRLTNRVSSSDTITKIFDVKINGNLKIIYAKLYSLQHDIASGFNCSCSLVIKGRHDKKFEYR